MTIHEGDVPDGHRFDEALQQHDAATATPIDHDILRLGAGTGDRHTSWYDQVGFQVDSRGDFYNIAHTRLIQSGSDGGVLGRHHKGDGLGARYDEK